MNFSLWDVEPPFGSGESRIRAWVSWMARNKAVMLISRSCILVAPALVVALALAGCAATPQITNQWTNPFYTSLSLKSVMVIGVSKQTNIRRTFEDEFVAQLRATGINAIPSYQYIQEDGQVGEERLKQAVKNANADAAIITRLVRIEQRTNVIPGFYEPVPAYGFYGWYSSGWLGHYEPPQVYHYEVYVSETSLYDMIKNEVVWTGTLRTTAPGDIKEEVKRYAETVIQAIKENNLL